MKRLSRAELEQTAKELMAKGYSKLHATNDGQFFTDHENATANGKKIGSEVYTFTGDTVAYANASASDPPVGDPPAGDPATDNPPAAPPPASDPPAGNPPANSAGGKKVKTVKAPKVSSKNKR